MAKKVGRETIHFQCTECNEINYTTNKDKRNHPERMELKKYCRRDRRHTLHREMKK